MGQKKKITVIMILEGIPDDTRTCFLGLIIRMNFHNNNIVIHNKINAAARPRPKVRVSGAESAWAFAYMYLGL